MFYKAPDMTPEQAKKDGLIGVNVNIIEIININIDKNNEPLVSAWNIVKDHFDNANDCWATIGYVTEDGYEGGICKPTIWKRIIDFWWVS